MRGKTDQQVSLETVVRASKAIMGFILVSYEDVPPHPLDPSALILSPTHLSAAGTFLGDSSHPDIAPMH